MAKKNKDEDSMAGFQRFLLNSKRIFAIATKPSRKQFAAMMKICLIGLGIIGGLSFIIQLIASVVSK